MRTATLFWNSPAGTPLGLFAIDPAACRLLEALAMVGGLSSQGLATIADIWCEKKFRDGETFQESEHLIQATLEALIEKKLPRDSAEHRDIHTLYDTWQMPMYSLDLSPIPMTVADLANERDRLEAQFYRDVY